MTREELQRSWQITIGHLNAARDEISAHSADAEFRTVMARYEDWLSQNELEFAFDELDGFASTRNFSETFWSELFAAAKNMGLAENAERCRVKCIETRAANSK